MTNLSTIYKLSLLVLFTFFVDVYGTSCPVLECWFVQEKGRGGGFSAGLSQEKSLLHVSTDPDSDRPGSHHSPPADIDPSRIFQVTDPAGTLCNPSLQPPEGAVEKPVCEINPFLPQPSAVQWATALTDSAHSPIYLQADWYSTAVQGLDGQLALSSVMRAPTATTRPSVILSVYSRTAIVRSQLGRPVLLDCGFWADPASPLSGSGFAVEWRYQFRGHGRLVLAYDSKSDRLAETREEGAALDFAALHRTRNASLLLQEAQVRHSGTYICSVYLPYLVSQVAVELEIVEPPSLSLYPPQLPVAVPGQTVTVQCEASGFFPLTLELGWEFLGVDGKARPLGRGSVTGHRHASDGTYSQSSRLELDAAKMDLGRGGEVTCVAVHAGGTRRISVPLHVIGVSPPSIEDSMVMVVVALGLYGLIKLFAWTFTGSASTGLNTEEKKEK